MAGRTASNKGELSPRAVSEILEMSREDGPSWMKSLLEAGEHCFDSGLKFIIHGNTGKIHVADVPREYEAIVVKEQVGESWVLDEDGIIWFVNEPQTVWWPVKDDDTLLPYQPGEAMCTFYDAVSDVGAMPGKPAWRPLKVEGYRLALYASPARKGKRKEVSIQRTFAKNMSDLLADPQFAATAMAAQKVLHTAVRNLPYKCEKCKHEVKPAVSRELIKCVEIVLNRYLGNAEHRPLQILDTAGEAMLELVIGIHNELSPSTTEKFCDIIIDKLGITR